MHEGVLNTVKFQVSWSSHCHCTLEIEALLLLVASVFLVIQFSYWWIHKLRAIHCYYLWIHTIYEDYKQIFLVLKLMMYYPTVLRPSSSLSTFNFFFFFTLVFTQFLNQGLPNVTWSRTYSSAQGTAILYSDLLNNVQYEPDFIQDQYLSG